MMKELTQEQVNQLGERMRNAAGNAAESSLPLMIRDLGKQIAESGDNKLEATLKIGLELNDGEWVISTAMEWTRKMKHKDAFDDVRVNFELPDLKGMDAAEADPIKTGVQAIETTARKLDAGEPVRMLGAGNYNPLCVCGHLHVDHFYDGEVCECQAEGCECLEFEADEAAAAPESTDSDFHMADEVDAAKARDARNAKKLAAKGIQAAYLADSEKTAFLLDVQTGKFVDVKCKSKAEAKRKLDGFYSDGMVRFHSLVSDFKVLAEVGFTTIIRLDTFGKRIKYTDATHSWATLVKYETADEGRAHMAAMMADPLILED